MLDDREYLLHVQRAIRGGVDNAIVWDILMEDLPRLRSVVDRILRDT